MWKLSKDVSEKQVLEAWLGLPGLIVEVCRRASVGLDVPVEPLLDGAATFLGFGSFAGFQTAMQYAARTSVLVREFAFARAVSGRNYDKTFLEKLSVAWKSKGARALENPPLPPLAVRNEAKEVDAERVESLSRLSGDLDYELGLVRQHILMAFSITERVISPQAFFQIHRLADHWIADAKTRIDEGSRKWLIQQLGYARFPEVSLMGGFPEKIEKDESWWSRQHFFSSERTLQEVWGELYRSNGGFAQVGRMRHLLQDQPCAWADVEWEDSPPAYLALGNAPDHAWFELQKSGEDYSLTGKGYVPHTSDIPPMLACSGYMPETIEPVSLAECEVRGMPPIVGWLRVEWSR
jgi:hypothetical protein